MCIRYDTVYVFFSTVYSECENASVCGGGECRSHAGTFICSCPSVYAPENCLIEEEESTGRCLFLFVFSFVVCSYISKQTVSHTQKSGSHVIQRLYLLLSFSAYVVCGVVWAACLKTIARNHLMWKWPATA